MYKHRLTNGFSDKFPNANPLSLHSLLKNYLDTNSVPKSFKEIGRSNVNIENLDKQQQEEFNGLIKGLKLKAGKLQMGRKNSIEAIQNPSPQQKKVFDRALRPKSKKKFVAKNKISVKTKLLENKSVKAFFRNQIISLMTLLNRRDDYFSNLKGKKQELIMPMKSQEVEQIFGKLLESKGKDKPRIKFNYMTNDQLKSLKYKAKPLATVNMSKKAKIKNGDYVDVESGEEEEDEDYREDNIDMATWKKRNGCGYNQKVYIVKGGYHQLRRTLNDKGWFQNQDVYSQFFDLKWTTQTCDIDYGNLKHGQAVNHFNNNHHLTSKYGLARRLKTIILPYKIDIDRFYPRCFDLGDQVDFQNFIQNFKFSFAQSCAKRFLVDKTRYKSLELKIRVIYGILKRRVVSLGEMVNSINNGSFPIITPEQWQIITETLEWDESLKKEKINKMRETDGLTVKEPELYQQQYFDFIDKDMRAIMDKLDTYDPQFNINGFRNVWIAKPNFLSRGRGIKCMNNLYDISNYCLGKDCQFVIQKYIENPLLVNGKKFDIRQWVLIQDYNPPTIWFYEECYLRFCGDQYSLDNIHNKFQHLTNNSIQKYHKNPIEDSMWDMKTFAEYIGVDKWKVVQQKIKNIIVWSIKACEGSVTGKRGFFQMVGYDFMIDENLNPWIIQINMSPSMDHSTPVTKKLVKMVQRDMGSFIASSHKKKQKNAGNFTCIYRNQQDLQKYKMYIQ